MTARLKQGDALLLVDVQNDFCPGGALPVPEGDEVVAELNGWIDEAERLGVPIFASQDWHPDGHVSFAADRGRGTACRVRMERPFGRTWLCRSRPESCIKGRTLARTRIRRSRERVWPAGWPIWGCRECGSEDWRWTIA